MKFKIFTVVFLSFMVNCQSPENQPTAENQQATPDTGTAPELDSVSGLVIDENFELIRGQCTPCHSAKLITQNSASREGWEQMIRWMQKDQGLWDLGENEELILNYLTLHYGIKKKGRRSPLENIDWYRLQDEL